MTPIYARMIAAIEAVDLDKMLEGQTAEEQLRLCRQIATNFEPAHMVSEIRLRGERCHAMLLRQAAGLSPKNRRDAKWLATFEGEASA